MHSSEQCKPLKSDNSVTVYIIKLKLYTESYIPGDQRVFILKIDTRHVESN